MTMMKFSSKRSSKDNEFHVPSECNPEIPNFRRARSGGKGPLTVFERVRNVFIVVELISGPSPFVNWSRIIASIKLCAVNEFTFRGHSSGGPFWPLPCAPGSMCPSASIRCAFEPINGDVEPIKVPGSRSRTPARCRLLSFEVIAPFSTSAPRFSRPNLLRIMKESVKPRSRNGHERNPSLSNSPGEGPNVARMALCGSFRDASDAPLG